LLTLKYVGIELGSCYFTWCKISEP